MREWHDELAGAAILVGLWAALVAGSLLPLAL